MTGREKLEGQRHWVVAVVIVGMGLFLGGMFVGKQLVAAGALPPVVWVVPISGFAGIFLGMLYAQFFGFRCPWCRGNMAALMLQRSIFDRRVQFCPYCGRNLDEEIESAPADADYTSEYDR